MTDTEILNEAEPIIFEFLERFEKDDCSYCYRIIDNDTTLEKAPDEHSEYCLVGKIRRLLLARGK